VLAVIVLDRTRGRQRKSLGLLFVGALVFLFFIPDRVWGIFRSVAPAIEKGTDTVGLRYKLWDAGLAMWHDHPLTGVGIGQFASHLREYGVQRSLGAHNIYVQVLAETGTIGAILFVALIGTSLVALWRATRCADKELSPLAKAWLTVFVVLLVGGLTKHDLADKLLWSCIGVGFYFELRIRHLAVRARSRIPSSRRVRLATRAVRPGTMLVPVRRMARHAQTPRGAF
jgi:O-antigen ligase